MRRDRHVGGRRLFTTRGAALIAQLRMLDALALVDLASNIGKIDNRPTGGKCRDDGRRRIVEHRRRRRVRFGHWRRTRRWRRLVHITTTGRRSTGTGAMPTTRRVSLNALCRRVVPGSCLGRLRTTWWRWFDRHTLWKKQSESTKNMVWEGLGRRLTDFDAKNKKLPTLTKIKIKK